MKIQKPNWTPADLYAKANRHRQLTDETINHDIDCDCNACMELFGLQTLLELFDEDENVTAVIEANKSREIKL